MNAAMCYGNDMPTEIGLDDGEYGIAASPKDTIIRFGRIGLIDNSLLVVLTLAGYSLDEIIAKRIGVPGYGPMLGAVVGSAITDALAGIREGRAAAIGLGLGALLPVLPVAIALLAKKELKGATAVGVGIASLVLMGLSFLRRQQRSIA